MAPITVPPADYVVLASILNDFGRGRGSFTFGTFESVMARLGFKTDGRGSMWGGRFGNKPFAVAKHLKQETIVTGAMQDQWKVVLYNLYGWDEETFA